ncbi:GumC family protein [Bacteroides sp. AN502(2024)]|uniref:GumC family protein n=1 Tax=Bacteroides sp. AN502(2024) TaxID=3160599 RepID=UPI003510F029
MERNIRNNREGGAARPSAAASMGVQIKDVIYLCLGNWKWFALSLLITLGAAVYYIKSTPAVYTRTLSMLLKTGNKQSVSEEMMNELGMGQTPVNITNEILALKSSQLLLEIVKRLHLDVDYAHDGSFHKLVAYGTDLPVTVSFHDLGDKETAALKLTLNADSTVAVRDMKRNGNRVEGALTMKLGSTAQTPLGKLTVAPSPYYKQGETDELEVGRIPASSVAGGMGGRLSVSLRDKNSTIIDIAYKDLSIARAEDVLNMLVAVYNENWVKDRNQRMVSTNEFIRERLGVIEQELSGVEQDISDYKAEHLMPNVEQMGSMAVAQMNSAEQQSHELSNQIYAIRYVRDYLTNGQHDNQLLPSNSGINSANIAGQINEYNSIMLQRNNHLANSSSQNPLVIDLTQHLNTLRVSIVQSLDNEQAMLQAKQRSVQANRSQAVAKIASNPGQAKYLLSVERQQKVKESLYLYLLQKREENELSQTFTAYNSQLLEAPHGSMAPTEPVSRNILAIAFMLGLAVPGGLLFLREWMTTTVRGRKDLEQMRTPFVGEIPLDDSDKKTRRKGAGSSPRVLVMEENRNAMNEAFRVVRTNLEFILGFDSSHKVVMTTSMHPGSGKTFTTANLSAALAIKGKRVLMIDLDLRKGSLSRYLEGKHRGVSNYLSGQEPDYHTLIRPLGQVDMLPCGTLPPNPTELLFAPRFEELMRRARAEYDYVFIDCPPAEIVADAAIISRYVDLTLFIVRAHKMERVFLPEIDRWYEEKRYKNLSVLLNGTESFGRYGYHKYGYRYGYQYGGYGTGNKK